MGVVEVAPVTLHRKPFMYTVRGISGGRMEYLSQLTLRGTAVHGVDPMPGTDAAAFGTGRHVLGDLEWGVDFPNTFVVDTENSQIFGFDAVHVGSVRDREGTTLQVLMALRGNE